jgi:hypothetical protein
MIWSFFESLGTLTLLLIWVAELLAVGFFYMRTRSKTVGLVLAYLVGLWLIHWMGALACYANPEPPTEDIQRYTEMGFALTTLGLNSFLVGVLLTTIFSTTKPAARARRDRAWVGQSPSQLIGTFLGIGALAYVLSSTPLARLPTLGNLLTSAKLFFLAGTILLCWDGLRHNNKAKLLAAVALVVLLPGVTVMTDGFLSYGVGAATMVFTFLSTVYRPRWQVAVAGMLALVLGLSLFVTYMRDRATLRATVWGGATMSTRVEQVGNTLTDFELFDPREPRHWNIVMSRLNQNELVGRSYEYTPQITPFEHGATVWLSVINLVPRAIWPNKPVTGGSGRTVSEHTGLEFAQGTSVGIGQPMEFYINFGIIGLVIGYILYGALLTWLDRRAACALLESDYPRFLFWFLAGGSMLNPGGALAEVTGSMVAGFLMGQLVIWAQPDRGPESRGHPGAVRA